MALQIIGPVLPLHIGTESLQLSLLEQSGFEPLVPLPAKRLPAADCAPLIPP